MHHPISIMTSERKLNETCCSSSIIFPFSSFIDINLVDSSCKAKHLPVELSGFSKAASKPKGLTAAEFQRN